MKRSNNNIDKEIYQSPTVKESIKLAMSETPAEEFQLELMQTLSQFDNWQCLRMNIQKNMTDLKQASYHKRNYQRF